MHPSLLTSSLFFYLPDSKMKWFSVCNKRISGGTRDFSAGGGNGIILILCCHNGSLSNSKPKLNTSEEKERQRDGVGGGGDGGGGGRGRYCRVGHII